MYIRSKNTGRFSLMKLVLLGAIIISTASAQNRHGKLQNEIKVDGNTSGTFVFNLDGKIVDDGSKCDMQPPAMSYR